MTNPAPRLHGRLLMYMAVLSAIALYATGLQGPFLLDDLPNLLPLQGWLDGTATAEELILGNQSGILGRPLSMATLWLSAATGGMHPFPFKLGNLLVHIICGFVGWQLLRRLLERDPHLAAKANLVAAVLAGLWLVHPINVSTVLYAVQRMAQLSALFVLASVWAYVLARQQLADGNTRGAFLKLFVLFPLLLVAGLLSKENAAVAPALCLVIELAYFLKKPRPGKLLPVFYAIFVLIPAVLLLAAVLLYSPERVIGSFAGRDFSMGERLLSQSRALWEYIGLMLWPRGGFMGVFVDDFSVSTGLLSPPSTLLSLIGLLVVSIFAIAVRRQAPSMFAGWFFFLVAHSIESTVFPLELYFEHRNYLPAWGLLLAVVGLLSWLAGKLPSIYRERAGRAGFVLAGIAALSFAFVTWHQVRVWRSEITIAEQALEYRPTSLRAHLSKATALVRIGRYDDALRHTSAFINSPNPRHRLQGNLHTLTVDCLRGQGADPVYVRQAEQSGVRFVTLPDAQALTQLSRAVGTGRCGPAVTDAVVADSISRLLDELPQPDWARGKYLMRGSLATMYMNAGRWEDAQRQAELAWRPAVSDTAIGGMLIGIYLHNGNIEAAQRTLDEVRTRVHDYERVAMQRIGILQTQIDAAASP